MLRLTLLAPATVEGASGGAEESGADAGRGGEGDSGWIEYQTV